MRLFPLFALASLPLLGACQVIGLHPARLEPQRIAWEQHAAGCQGERCSLVNVDTLKFAEQPRLNALIEQALLAMTQGSAGGPAPATLRDYAREQLRQAPEGRETWLQAKLIDQHDDLAVIELSSYLDEGGAHGLPGRGFRALLRLCDTIDYGAARRSGRPLPRRICPRRLIVPLRHTAGRFPAPRRLKWSTSAIAKARHNRQDLLNFRFKSESQQVQGDGMDRTQSTVPSIA